MLLPPLPNFLFQRDPSCWIYDGVTLNPMTKPAREPETLIMEAIYRFHPMFTAEELPDLVRRRRRGLGPLARRGRRRAADRQRRGDDRDGRADHARRRSWISPGSCSAPVPRTLVLAVQLPQVAQLHAPRHGDHDVRPRPRSRSSRRSSTTAPDLGRSAPATRPTTCVIEELRRATRRGAWPTRSGSTEMRVDRDRRRQLRGRARAVGRRQQRRRARARRRRRLRAQRRHQHRAAQGRASR